MSIEIKTLIKERPYLEEPLKFYGKWQEFHRQAAELRKKTGSASVAGNSPAYPQESSREVFRLFVSSFNLPAEITDPIHTALASGSLDFMQFPLEKMPDSDTLLTPLADDELATILFLFSRSFFLGLRETCLLDGTPWQNGRCPLCSAKPAIASVATGSKRLLYCSWCGTSGSYRYTGCPNCGSSDSGKISNLIPDDDDTFRVAACDACHTYVKVVEESIPGKMTADLADLASLTLDIIAQDKGYTRKAPNPIGLTTMR